MFNITSKCFSFSNNTLTATWVMHIATDCLSCYSCLFYSFMLYQGKATWKVWNAYRSIWKCYDCSANSLNFSRRWLTDSYIELLLSRFGLFKSDQKKESINTDKTSEHFESKLLDFNRLRKKYTNNPMI